MPHHGRVAYDKDEEEDGLIYTRSTLELRRQQPDSTRFATTALSAFLGQEFGWRKPKVTQITTAPGQLGAGETETEADEPVSSRVTLCLPPHPLSQAVLKALYPLLPSQLIFRLPVSCLFQNLWSHPAS